MPKLIGINLRGNRVGEDHGRAVLTNHEVTLVLELHDDGGWGYRRLARAFGVSKTLIRKICKGEIRCQIPARYKRCT